MAVLQKTRILAQERLDKTDYDNIETFVCEDLNQMFRRIFTSSTAIINGFEIFDDAALTQRTPSASPVYIKMEDSTILHTDSSGPSFYVGSSITSAEEVTLTDGQTNYIELDISREPAVPATRTFRDPNANAGEGADYTQIIDTVENIVATITVNTTGFSGGTKVPLYKVTVAAGSITAAVDSRNLFFRLVPGEPYNEDYEFPWTSRGEPDNDLVPDGNEILKGDKQIQSFKDWADAIMTELKVIKFGSAIGVSWTDPTPTSISQLGRELFLRGGGTISWDGSDMTWTSNFTIDITGTAFVNTITTAGSPLSIGADQVAYVDVDPTQTTNISFQVVDSDSYVDQDNRYILVKRDGSDIIIIDRLVG